MARLKKLFRRIGHELIPAPTLRRLAYIARIVRGPRTLFYGDVARILLRVLGPVFYLRLKQVVKKYIVSRRPVPVAISETVLPDQQACDGVTSSALAREENLNGPFFFNGKVFADFESLKERAGVLSADVAICISFSGRFDILETVVKEANNRVEGLSTLVVLAGTSERDAQFLREITLRYETIVGTVTQNTPVGRKWQTVVDLALAIGNFNLLGITGSDDVLPTELIKGVVERHRKNTSSSVVKSLVPALYATMEWLVFSSARSEKISPQLVRCNYKLGSALMPLGAGRFYAREALDRFDGQIFDTRRNNLLDDKGFYLVQNNGMSIEYYGLEEGAVLSVKGDWEQMNSFSALLGAERVDVRDYSFAGYNLLKRQTSQQTLKEVFG